MSNRGTIIHLDNDEKKLDEFKRIYDQHDIDLELIPCQSKDEFSESIKKNHDNLRCLIFDLLGDQPGTEELLAEEAEFLDSIESSFSDLSVPIFIYSGFIEKIEERFNGHGTVFKIDKTEGPDEILRLLKIFNESGFLDVFCPGGKIENEFHKDLNKAFVNQFSDNKQIEAIINTVQTDNVEETKRRVEKILKRIAVRSLLTDLHLSEIEGEEEYLNPVEHYVKRINDQEIVTGDIFYSQEKGEYLLVITPRCDLANKDPQEILVCKIDTDNFPEKTNSNNQKMKILSAITDNPEYSGYDRYLVRSPFFIGGLIKIGSYSMISKDQLLSEYNLEVTLSDELTNEILGKFGSYFFRTGITTWDLDETVNFLESIKEEN